MSEGSTIDLVTAAAAVVAAVGSIAAVGVTIYLAVRESQNRQERSARDALTALDAMDRELRSLDSDAAKAIDTVSRTIPAVPGFRLQLDALSFHLGRQQELGITKPEHDAVAFVFRQASDANRAMDAAQAAPDSSADRARQYQLIALKVGHLCEANENGISRLQQARKAISAARRRLLEDRSK